MNKIYGQITGWGSYVPEKVLTNFDLEKMVDTTNEWIIQRSGIHERHIAAPDETTSMMSVNAAEKAIQRAGISPNELDLIIVANSSPDYFTPPVSSQVQHALGATNVPAFVVETGCTGFVYALSTAYQFIAAGAYRTILVIGVEILSRFTNWEDRSTCVLFGDAAGAVVVQATEQPCGLHGFVLGSDGSQAEHIIMRAGGTVEPFSEEVLLNRRHLLHMNGRQVFKFATRVVGRACCEALEKAGMTLDDVDWIIPHQANLRIIQAAARDMGLPMSRFIVNIDRYGNTSAASIPLALAENLENGRIQPGDTGIFVSFGAGLTWGAMVVQLNPNGMG
jgi:3-oxoacyl-[acyl-carrier-protein] synthase-3